MYFEAPMTEFQVTVTAVAVAVALIEVLTPFLKEILAVGADS
jgi:hypothetical protein